ncbi:laccase [Moniliophthora roreri MCA 2997]|uniref:Laccase n=1 Tax=Moniliophthora roreri (strain MCA 2997) TaxID=1381753 RepID=V2WZ01_MONRO|nr:laccase [Moniliophthora roreri MCA 2997]
MCCLFLFISAVCSLARAVEIITRTGDLHIVNNQISPDGFQRPVVLAGQTSSTATFPGPLIRANKGDELQINVINELTDPSMDRSTTIHWHGLFQLGTNWADGPEFVTQCPIVPGNSFKYQFSVPDHAGTYWYHSHFRAQYCDGLRGPLVIYDPQDPHRDLYDIDDEYTIITLADWYHRTSPKVLASQLKGPPEADSTLINGLGRYAHGDPTAPLAIVNVIQGKCYRFRLISISCDPNYTFSIDGHNMTIIEADGVNVEPVTVNKLTIFAAQRYSFVLCADQPVGNYWIRAEPGNGTRGFENGINSAILRYKNAKELDPDTKEATDTMMLRETDLHFLSPDGKSAVPGRPFPGGADLVLNMTLGFALPATFMINQVPFHVPDVPVLLQILSGAQTAQDLLPADNVFELPRNKVIEINFFDDGIVGGPHPMHLHGHTFDVIKSADSPDYNFKNPVRRDTVSVGGNSTTTIRFVTDNPGPWFLHCHIDFHLVEYVFLSDFSCSSNRPHLKWRSGLAVVLAEGTQDTKLANPVPPDWSKLCPIWDSTPHDIRD